MSPVSVTLPSTPRGEGQQDVVSQQEAVTFRFDVSHQGPE